MGFSLKNKKENRDLQVRLKRNKQYKFNALKQPTVFILLGFMGFFPQKNFRVAPT